MKNIQGTSCLIENFPDPLVDNGTRIMQSCGGAKICWCYMLCWCVPFSSLWYLCSYHQLGWISQHPIFSLFECGGCVEELYAFQVYTHLAFHKPIVPCNQSIDDATQKSSFSCFLYARVGRENGPKEQQEASQQVSCEASACLDWRECHLLALNMKVVVLWICSTQPGWRMISWHARQIVLYHAKALLAGAFTW